MPAKFQQHLQTGISTIATAVLLWVGVSLSYLQQGAAEVKVELEYIKTNLEDIKETSDQAYPLSQAMQDRKDIKDLEARVRMLEVRGGVTKAHELYSGYEVNHR